MGMSERRAYDNSRRAAQADETARRILDAAIALMGTPGAELSTSAIAAEAAVAPPTVYKHFPNRQAIFEAVQERINERFGRPAWPASVEELRLSIGPLHRFFGAQEALVRAVVTAPELHGFWEVTRRGRDEAIAHALEGETRHLPKEEARAAAAMAVRIVGIETWLDLKDAWGLSDAAVTAATSRALDALLASLRRERNGKEPSDGR